MPFNELQRRDSWPPTIIRIRDDAAQAEEPSDIDENPFSFFLTSPDDIDLDDDEDLSAGIESSIKVPAVREISLSAIQRSPLPFEDDEDEEIEYAFAMPVSLKEFQTRYTDGRTSRQEQRADHELAGLGIAIPDFAMKRGRATVKLTPSKNGRGRGQTRSLSARRPHSWRLPSPDIVSIKEERECDDGEEQGKVELKKEMSVSAPPSPEVAKEAAKPKKRVHWAF